MRAAHSLSADPLVDVLVVLGPAKSNNFEVVRSADGLDVLVGSGARAPYEARKHSIPLIWDGDEAAEGVVVWGASVVGLAAAIAKRQRNPIVVAAAHPDAPQGSGPSVRFAKPLGATQVDELELNGISVGLGKSYNEYAGCLVTTKKRQITVVDRSLFLSGIALAAGLGLLGNEAKAVWDQPLEYLKTATGMGLVMAEAAAT